MQTNRKIARTLGDRSGFTLVEVLVASMILVVALLTLASMFPVGYRQIADAGRLTVATTGARHIMEDLGSLPFGSTDCATPPGNLDCFNPAATGGKVFDTNNSATLPGADPAESIARRWRYMLAGSGSGFTFTSAETTAWGTAQPFGGRATVRITTTSATRRTATVTVTIPSTPPTTVTLSTIIVRMF